MPNRTTATGIFNERTESLGTFDVTTAEGRKQFSAAMKQLASIRSEFEREWLNRVEHNLKLIVAKIGLIAKKSSASALPDYLRRAWEDATEALDKIETFKAALKGRNPKLTLKSAYLSYEIGFLEQRAIMRTFDQFVREGKRTLFIHGGVAMRVTEQESKLLSHVVTMPSVPLDVLCQSLWETSYHRANRSKLDKCLSQINSKLAENRIPFSLLVRGDNLIRDDHFLTE